MKTFVGIDVSKNKLDIAWLRDSNTIKIKTVVIDNNPKGFADLDKWLMKHLAQPTNTIHIVLEATSVYHENVALFLFSLGYHVSVMNPAYVRSYANSLGTVHKTDKKDSVILARFGAERQPDAWQPPAPEIRELKALLARLKALSDDVQREVNRQEKMLSSHLSSEVKKSHENIMTELEKERQRLEKLIDDHIDRHPQLKRDHELMQSIPGVGNVVARTMLVVLHEHQFKRAEDCAAYLGLIPKAVQSGVFKGRTRLSKKGPSHIRATLYMPAVTAKRCNPAIRALCERMIAAGKTQMQAIGAAMRKLVHQCFGVVKNQTKYSYQVALTTT